MSIQIPEKKPAIYLQAVHNYPRVLIIYMSCINENDQFGISIRNWFAEWPKENLAQIYSGNVTGNDRFCGHNYQLGPQDRNLGTLFFKLKGSYLAQSEQLVLFGQEKNVRSNSINHFSKLKHQFGEFIMSSGIWELVFSPILSSKLLNWVEEFKPDLIYAQGYNISFAKLPIMLHERLQTPICFQTGDDWPKWLYAKSILSPLIRPIVERESRNLIQAASLRFTNGEKMNTEYTLRYRKLFSPLMMCDDFQKYRGIKPIRLDQDNTISIVYSGGLAHNRWESLIDLSKAVEELLHEGIRVHIHAFTSDISIIASKELDSIPNTSFHPLASPDEVPRILKGADILFLPETFNNYEAKKIGLSISTKAHIYMMSEKPILVYGSYETGAIDYARKYNWAYVVDEQDINELKNAIRRISFDPDLRRKLITRGGEIANLNHNGAAVRNRFKTELCSLRNEYK